MVRLKDKAYKLGPYHPEIDGHLLLEHVVGRGQWARAVPNAVYILEHRNIRED